MALKIEFIAYRKQKNGERLNAGILSYETESDNNLSVSDDKINSSGVAITYWNDIWKNKIIYVYCTYTYGSGKDEKTITKFVTWLKITESCIVKLDVSDPDRDPRD